MRQSTIELAYQTNTILKATLTLTKQQ